MADENFKDRVTRQGEEAAGRIAQDLLDNSLVSGMLTAALQTRERAMRAQELTLGALNLPSAGDLERLTRRLRSVSQRLEGIEDGLDRVEDRLTRPAPASSQNPGQFDERLTRIEAALDRLEAERAPAPAKAVPAKAVPAKAVPAKAVPAKAAPAKSSRGPARGSAAPKRPKKTS